MMLSLTYVSVPFLGKAFVDLFLLYQWTSVFTVVDNASVPFYAAVAPALKVAMDKAATATANFTNNVGFLNYQRPIFAQHPDQFRAEIDVILQEFKTLSRGNRR